MTVVTRTSGCPAGPCTVAILICLFEILEEKDKSTLTYQEPGTWQSLMEVFFGHQHRKPNPPPWPLQSVPRPSMILMEIVGLQNRNDESPDLAGSLSSSASRPASETSGSERVSWTMCLDMLVGSGCCIKAKHKAYNLFTVWSLLAGELRAGDSSVLPRHSSDAPGQCPSACPVLCWRSGSRPLHSVHAQGHHPNT